MRRVLMWGYLKNNFGDDLFIYTLARSLPDTEFILIAPPNYRQYSKEKNILWINSNFFIFVLLSKFLNAFVVIGRKLKLTKRINIVREQLIADILSLIIRETVYISGSVFMESDNSYDMFAKKQLDSWLYNRKPYVLGINFGPYKTDAFLQSSIGFLNQAKLVTFRDTYSYNLLKNKLATKSMYSPDVAFAFSGGGGYTSLRVKVTAISYRY